MAQQESQDKHWLYQELLHQDAETIASMLPPRYVNTVFDELYELSCFKSKSIWYVRYINVDRTGSFIQGVSSSLKKAMINVLLSLQKEGIRFHTCNKK